MVKISKRMRVLKDQVNSSKLYSILDGLDLIKKISRVKFIETVDVAINLGIDSRKSDQNVRNFVVMPHGIGREIFVAVLTQGMNVELAKQAGADLVGLEDIFHKIKNKDSLIDVIVASPDVMKIVSTLGPTLGPRGLMPNPKLGTVSDDIEKSVKDIKSGQVHYRNDKNGIVHVTIGKINFDTLKLKENLEALIFSLKQIKPVQFKGIYIKKISVSATMGRSVTIDQSNFL